MLKPDSLGTYLRELRARLDPTALGYAAARRRTPGLRREEVALRAGISATWYSWLEQGRGGAPSAGVLDRVAEALLLSEIEREHLFVLGLGRLPEIRYDPPGDIAQRMQKVLDAMPANPALIRTVCWDVVAWNAAAAVVLTDYGRLPLSQRNVLRLMFLDPSISDNNDDWEEFARFVVGVFRADAARACASHMVQPLIEELCRSSTDFAKMWNDADVRGFEQGIKRLRHPKLGAIALEYSAFGVDGRSDLTMLICNPISGADAGRITALLERS